MGGAHQQTSERAAPPVSVEEKGKTTGDKKENCYYFCLWAYKIKINFFYVVRGPQNTIKSHLVFTALFCFAPFSVFFSRMSAPYWKPAGNIFRALDDFQICQNCQNLADKSTIWPRCFESVWFRRNRNGSKGLFTLADICRWSGRHPSGCPVDHQSPVLWTKIEIEIELTA
jgi:hypothetical protein